MENLKDVILDAVNLESYSSSHGFVGYFERVGRYMDGMAELAVTQLADVLDSECGELAFVSSLHANEDEVGRFGDVEMDKRDKRLVDSLCARNALRRFSYNERFGKNYESDSYTGAVHNELENFVVTPVASLGCDVAKQLLVARMLVYGLRGHCFLVCARKGLIFYPHDETGFGVIVFGATPHKNFAIEFLCRAGRLERFRSSVEK